MLVIQAEEGEGSGHPSEPQPPPSTAQPNYKEPIPNVTSKPIPNVPDEVVYEKWDDRVETATTTAASLDTEQAGGNINRTQSTAIPNVPLPQEIGVGGSPRCQEAMGGSIAQTRSERVPTQPYDSPLPRVNTLGSDEGSMTLLELTVLCTTLSKKVESLEADLKQTKKVYGGAYTNLIKKVKKLEKTVKSNQARRRAKIMVLDDEEDLEDSSKQGRMIEEIDQDTGVTLVTPTHNVSKENVYIYTRRRRAVSTGKESVNTVGSLMTVVIKDKEERKRIARVHEEVSSFNIKEWEDIQATIKADEELAQRMQAEEREKYSKAEKARLLAELINQRKRYFAQQRAEERRNKPLTLSFDELNNLFKATMRRVGAFVPIETKIRREVPELAARSTKRDAEEELDQGSSKRQKTSKNSEPAEESKEKENNELSQEELQQLMIIVPEERMNVEAL
ncbi:hypothetical protein Tco_1308029 [Tanacetum coccineum]